jgi:hypothetical protein
VFRETQSYLARASSSAIRRLASGKNMLMNLNSGILARQWKKLTGLPFVYALWLIRPEVGDAKSIAQRLRGLRDENLTDIQAVVSDAVADVADNKQEITRNFSIVTTTRIFDSALELAKSKGCRLLQIFARNTECCQSERASLAWCKKLHRDRANRSRSTSEINARIGQSEVDVVKLPA